MKVVTAVAVDTMTVVTTVAADSMKVITAVVTAVAVETIQGVRQGTIQRWS